MNRNFVMRAAVGLAALVCVSVVLESQADAKLFGRHRGGGCGSSCEPSCGAPVEEVSCGAPVEEVTCGCPAPEASCGCEASCCESGGRKHRLFGGRRNKGCGCETSCGCAAEVSCGTPVEGEAVEMEAPPAPEAPIEAPAEAPAT